MSFTNLYYKRTAGTPKACYVCYKPTTTVLATINTVDFIYTCPGHLSDPGFASQVGEANDGASGARKLGLSSEEIAKVKAEWEEKQRLKEKKEKEKEKDDKAKDDKTKDDKKDDKKDDEDEKPKSKPASPTTATPSSPSPSPGATHQRYTLHRDFFSMRLAEHRKRRQATQAKELAPRLPGAPRSDISG
ncbi:hypothetical protein Moror_1409 [Moniliophthora roreri MCA 2997]|uniref:DUF1742-domain-containing protein n=2 Tax=Moniliophthora roreri TaxID=221103 RepID=V2XLJ9_MONRO|nr:hypothetical protein Moror_1409 [Moniliophthora roreri MCA 2997]